MVDTAYPVLTAKAIQLRHDPQRVDGLAVERYGKPVLETDLHVRRFIRAVTWITRPAVDVAWRLGPWVLQHTCLDRPSPQVLVGRVRGAHRCRNLDPVLGR